MLFLENETKFATASEDSTICIWFTQTGELFKTLTGHTDRIWNLIELTDNRYNIEKIDSLPEAVIIKLEFGISKLILVILYFRDTPDSSVPS